MKLWALLGAAAAVVVACGPASMPAGGGRVAIDVAALGLAGVDDVTYTLSVANESGETVWSRQLDADGYGDGVGSLSYVGSCDADDDPNDDGTALNTVSLTVDAVVAGGVTLTAGVDYANPAPTGAPLTRAVACVDDADVAVQIDLTLARRATQGFFDVAVSFEDVFCSGKLDCVDDGGQPLELLHAAGGDRGRTVVVALACTGGPGSDTWMYADAVTLDCGAAGSVDLAPVEPAGNRGAVAPWLFQYAVYFGAEQLGDGGTSYGKAYWNVALGVDEAALPTTDACTLAWRATASSARFDVGAAPDGTTWPAISWSVPLTTAGSGALTCTRHPLYGEGSGVAVGYAAGVVWPYEMYGDALAGGAGAFARESGANVTAPVWATATDLGTLAYDGALDVTLSAADADPGATVTYSSADLPAWLSLDGATGRLTGATVDEGELGAVSFTVVASDGVHDTPRTFTLNALFGAHCEAIRQAQPALSGLSVHVVDPVGDGAAPFDVLCDMTTYGGGWTLVTAQHESGPILWDEGRQADYDPTLATGASFALTGADLGTYDQLAWGRVASTGPGTWDAAYIDYAAFTYDPAADYAEVSLAGLATPSSYQLDRHSGTYHGNHNPESATGTDPQWFDTLTIDTVGGRYFTWAFSPHHTTVGYRGFAYEGYFRGGTEAFAWALWTRPGAAHTPAPAAAPLSCNALKQASPGLTGIGLYTIAPAGGGPIDVLCDMSQWSGGWTLVAAQNELSPSAWSTARSADTYTPSLTSNNQSFTLTGVDLPAHTQVAFGRARIASPGVWSTEWIDYVSYVYTTGNITPPVRRSGLATANSYDLHRSATLYYGSHDPEGSTGSTSTWNNTLTFDRVVGSSGAPSYTWAFSPQHTTQSYRGYSFNGAALWSVDTSAWFWAVWVR
ncbi:MAG: hypothetical protein EP329_13385 [Deltaproteobacteria bacterium]|nr:MAG: hypothetical protein EP329_13385 [Deltaproteobacteria bacterium]